MQKAPNADAYIEQQRRAIASNPDCGTSHYNLAVALLGQGKIEEGEKSLMTAIECSPGLAEAYVQMGGLCLKRGDLEGCLDWNRRAVKVKPSFSEGWGNIGFVLLQQGDLEGAITALKKATAFNFRFIQAFATLANAYLMNGQIKESIETNLKALKLSPDFAVAHNNLAIAYLEDGQPALVEGGRAPHLQPLDVAGQAHVAAGENRGVNHEGIGRQGRTGPRRHLRQDGRVREQAQVGLQLLPDVAQIVFQNIVARPFGDGRHHRHRRRHHYPNHSWI